MISGISLADYTRIETKYHRNSNVLDIFQQALIKGVQLKIRGNYFSLNNVDEIILRYFPHFFKK